MNYVGYVNSLIRKKASEANRIVIFGQNIDSGSCISGLSRGIKVDAPSRVINTPNSENTLVGAGFGLMLDGVNASFIMKQLDFLFLGIDQMTNTYNYIRTIEPQAAFTIITVIVDTGYEGMMASTNNLSDFCAISRTPGFCVTNRYDAEYYFENEFLKPGFRTIGLSQRLFKQDLALNENSHPPLSIQDGVFQYSSGIGCTIACFNFSYQYGQELSIQAQEAGLNPSLFSVNRAMPGSYESILIDLARTKKLIILDDSKCDNKLHFQLVAEAYRVIPDLKVETVTRDISSVAMYAPNADEFPIDYQGVINAIR
jgi:pyruvate/2-oxoglutarate/acetoin dehydrogenase E1 component